MHAAPAWATCRPQGPNGVSIGSSCADAKAAMMRLEYEECRARRFENQESRARRSKKKAAQGRLSVIGEDRKSARRGRSGRRSGGGGGRSSSVGGRCLGGGRRGSGRGRSRCGLFLLAARSESDGSDQGSQQKRLSHICHLT